MRKFEVGDKVRMTAKAPRRIGDVGELREGFDGTSFDWHVHFDDGDWCAVLDHEIELIVEPARKFAVGDKVRIKTSVTDEDLDDIAYPYESVGRDDNYTITAFSDEDVRLNIGWYVKLSMVELIDSIEAVESTTPANDDDAAVIRGVFAKVAGLSFLNENGEVLVFDEDGDGIAAMTLAQFNEVHRIINEGARSNDGAENR